jgi:hypothetical protein
MALNLPPLRKCTNTGAMCHCTTGTECKPFPTARVEVPTAKPAEPFCGIACPRPISCGMAGKCEGHTAPLVMPAPAAEKPTAEAPAKPDPVIPRNAPLAIRRVGNGFLVTEATTPERPGRRVTDADALVFQRLDGNGLLDFLTQHFDAPEDQR